MILLLVLVDGYYASNIDIAAKYFTDAAVYYDAGNYDKAVELYKKAVALEPSVATYRVALGTSLAKIDQYINAIEQFKISIEIDSNYTEGYYLIEDLYARANELTSGLEYFANEKRQYPTRAPIYINIGHLYYRIDSLDQAREEYSKARLIDMQDPTPLVGLGIIDLTLGQDSLAELMFKDAIALDTLYAQAYLYLSLVYEKRGDMETAAQLRDRAFKLKPSLQDIDLSEALPVRGQKADIPFIISSLDIILEKLVRPEVRKAIMEERKPFDLNLGLGFASIDDTPWLALTSSPSMDADWLGFYLALDFFINQDGEVRSRDLQLERIFQFARIGHPNLPVHVGAGAIQDYTLGYGLIMRGYLNQADENNRQIGSVMTLQNSANTIGLSGVMSSITADGIIGGRVFAGRWAPQPEDFLQRFEIAGTYVQDADQDIRIAGGDVLFYVASQGNFHFLLASEAAQILDNGFGNMSGLLLHIGGTSSRSFSVSLFGAGLFLGQDFVPAVFDPFYEKDRKQFGISFFDTLFYDHRQKSTGLYTMAGTKLGPVMSIAADYQSVTGISNSGLFSSRIIVAETVPFLRLQAFYYKYNFDELNSLFTFDENTYLAAIAGIKINPLISLNVLYERTYAWQENTFSYETQQKFSPFIKFGTTF